MSLGRPCCADKEAAGSRWEELVLMPPVVVAAGGGRGVSMKARGRLGSVTPLRLVE